jgi:hypothetical protein
MTIFTIIGLVTIIGLGWHWFNKRPALKGTPARTWPASRGKFGAKPKLTPLF